MKFILPYLKEISNLLFPDLCEYCQKESRIAEGAFCLPCLCELPLTGHEKKKDNLFIQHFPIDVRPENGAALFHLQAGGKVEKMLYRLKYYQQAKTGYRMGKHFASMLIKIEHWQDIDLIIPVPLHPKKQKKRGYNQSEEFARGLAAIWGKKMELQQLIRIKNTSTQTRMNRHERRQNTKEAFKLKETFAIEGKHILLVDDVLTTGSTLQACALQLLQAPGVKVSMATIAMGNM